MNVVALQKRTDDSPFDRDPDRSELSEHTVHHFQQMYVDAMGSDI